MVPAGYKTIYISGLLAPHNDRAGPTGLVARYGGSTEAQAALVFKRLEAALAMQNPGLGDVVIMRAYLVGAPAQGGAMDFAGADGGLPTLLWHAHPAQQAGARNCSGYWPCRWPRPPD